MVKKTDNRYIEDLEDYRNYNKSAEVYRYLVSLIFKEQQHVTVCKRYLSFLKREISWSAQR